jgi:uncharacterized LabA/DUF88 family protein
VWLRSDQVSVIRRNLQYPSDYPASRASEKGIDVAIAVDMIRLGMSGHMSAAILFSSDNDLMPAVEVLWDTPQCHVEVASWSGAHRIRFPGTQQPWRHHLNDVDFQAVRDTHDHSTHR